MFGYATTEDGLAEDGLAECNFKQILRIQLKILSLLSVLQYT